jgi:hypothetical protein
VVGFLGQQWMPLRRIANCAPPELRLMRQLRRCG